jgi:hypothetical protein
VNEASYASYPAPVLNNPAVTPVMVFAPLLGATLVPMSADEHFVRKSERLRAFLSSKAFYIAFGLYFASFLLPAVSFGEQPLFGYACAWLSLVFWASRENSSFLVIFGGLINPLAILYGVLRLFDKAPRFRLYLSNVILVFIPFTWLCLLVLKIGVLVGHVVWIAGLLLMVFSEAALQRDFRFARYGSAFALLILGGGSYHWLTTPTLSPIVDRDVFFYSVGINFQAPQSCSKIARTAGGGNSKDPGYQVAYLRSRCYYDLAQALNDTKLCDHVRPLVFEGQDGSRYSPAECRNKIPDPVSQRSSYLRREVFVQMMEAAGFEKQALDYRRSQYQERAAFFDLYEQVRQDTDFVAALRRLPIAYDWHAQPRPATGTEYLLDMLAIDETDEPLCSRISPTATYQFPDGKSFSLRSACVIHTLFYSGVGMCSELPSIRDRDFPLLSKYDSQESCSDSIRTNRYPDWGELPDARPIFFPTLESFQSALDEVGYHPGHNATTPKPTFNDYLELFFHIASHENSELRSEFVRRVMLLKQDDF